METWIPKEAGYDTCYICKESKQGETLTINFKGGSRSEFLCYEHLRHVEGIFGMTETILPFSYKDKSIPYSSNVRSLEELDGKKLVDAIFNLKTKKAFELCYFDPSKEEWLKYISDSGEKK